MMLPAATASQRILIVDDAVTIRRYYRSVAESAGFAVSEAANGLEGLERALVEDVALVLVDVNMPTMDGYAFLTQLRPAP